MSKGIIVFDLDGTLADGSHRLHLLPDPATAHITQSWDTFNLACSDDLPFKDNIELCNKMYYAGFRTVILTGRCVVAEKMTVAWLKANGVLYDELIMRPVNNHSKDVEFKEGELRRIGTKRILCCFDDLEHVAKHIRSMGITCHLVAHYDTPRLDTQERK